MRSRLARALWHPVGEHPDTATLAARLGDRPSSAVPQVSAGGQGTSEAYHRCTLLRVLHVRLRIARCGGSPIAVFKAEGLATTLCARFPPCPTLSSPRQAMLLDRHGTGCLGATAPFCKRQSATDPFARTRGCLIANALVPPRRYARSGSLRVLPHFPSAVLTAG